LHRAELDLADVTTSSMIFSASIARFRRLRGLHRDSCAHYDLSELICFHGWSPHCARSLSVLRSEFRCER
jgi:hypothetical protein